MPVTSLNLPARFAVDSGLGSLARHLRMLGFDTFWETDGASAELLRQAAEGRRAVITREEGLYAQAPEGRRHLLRAAGAGPELLEVIHAFGLQERVSAGRGFYSLCLQCNGTLLPVKGHHVHDRIPGEVLLAHTDFFFCPRCERVYWKGDGFERMRSWVSRLVSRG